MYWVSRQLFYCNLKRSRRMDAMRPLSKKRSRRMDAMRPLSKKRSRKMVAMTPLSKKRSRKMDDMTPLSKKRSRKMDDMTPLSKKRSRKMDDMTPLSKNRKMDDVMPLTRCIKQKKHLIGGLTDELLILILSRLNIHEAARTSILSRRWRYLWNYTTCSIEFYNDDTWDLEALENFINSVNEVLKLHQGESIERFQVSFVYPRIENTVLANQRRDKIKSDIDGWINFAIGKLVKILELNMAAGQNTSACFLFGSYSIPSVQNLFSICGEVKLLRALTTLKSIQFVNIYITEEVVEFFLAHCPLLEQVCITASSSLISLKVDGVLPNLRSMEISDCRELLHMEVHASSLLSFTFIGSNIEVPFKKVPNLSELFIGGDYADSFIFDAHEHSSYSQNLKKLTLLVSEELSLKCLVVPNVHPQLCNLKELELYITLEVGVGLCFFTFLAKCAPQLSRLTIELNFLPGIQSSIDRHREDAEPDVVEMWEQKLEDARSADRDAQEATTFCHKCLEVVKLSGFIGCSSDFSLAFHLLRVAGSLKKMILDSEEVCPSYKTKAEEAAMRAAAEQLKANLPPGAELLTYGPGFT